MRSIWLLLGSSGAGVEGALTLTEIIVGLRLEWGGFGYALAVRLFRRRPEVKRVRE